MLKRAINARAIICAGGCAQQRIAQALYRKYRYEVVGRRRGYYRDDGETRCYGCSPLDEVYRGA
jgi:ribosomal protein S18 acetylase RimI-like enzyme